jgi:hypothetical protein
LRLLPVLLILGAFSAPGAAAAAAETTNQTAGIEHVSPTEFAGKLQQAAEAAYHYASPLTDLLGQLSIAAAGVLLVLVLVLGAGIVRRIVSAVFVICLGIALWYFAPVIVEWVKDVAIWFQS